MMRKQEDMDRIIARRLENLKPELAISELMRAAQEKRIDVFKEKWDLVKELEQYLPPEPSNYGKPKRSDDIGLLRLRVQAAKALRAGEKLPGVPLPLP